MQKIKALRTNHCGAASSRRPSARGGRWALPYVLNVVREPTCGSHGLAWLDNTTGVLICVMMLPAMSTSSTAGCAASGPSFVVVCAKRCARDERAGTLHNRKGNVALTFYANVFTFLLSRSKKYVWPRPAHPTATVGAAGNADVGWVEICHEPPKNWPE